MLTLRSSDEVPNSSLKHICVRTFQCVDRVDSKRPFIQFSTSKPENPSREVESAVVLGLSKDTVAKHDKFKTKYELPFTLASDEDGVVCEAYGTWVEKSMYGRKYMGIDRTTFLIDEDGTLRAEWRKVKVPGHVDAVLQAARHL